MIHDVLTMLSTNFPNVVPTMSDWNVIKIVCETFTCIHSSEYILLKPLHHNIARAVLPVIPLFLGLPWLTLKT